MAQLEIGDIVGRKSYGCDVLFKVVNIREENGIKLVTLKGISYRIEADAPENDLEVQPENKVTEYRNKCMRLAEKPEKQIARRDGFRARYPVYSKKTLYRDTPNEKNLELKRPGTVLHIDGDPDYLETCINEYRKIGLNATGKYVPEKDQASVVVQLLEEYHPDILVLTGHEEFNNSEKIRHIQDLNYQCLSLSNEAKRNTNSTYLQKLKKVMEDKDEIVDSFFRGEHSFLKEKIVEQTLGLVVAYLKLLNNFCIRSREISGMPLYRYSPIASQRSFIASGSVIRFTKVSSKPIRK